MTGDTPHSILYVCSPSHDHEVVSCQVPGQGRKEAIPEQLGQANSQHLFQFLPSLLHLGKDVPPNCFLSPGLVVESSSSLLLRVSNHICDDLEVSALGAEPFLDEVLGLGAEAEHEVPLGLQLVDGLNGLMDLDIKRGNLLLVGGRGQEVTHLGLQGVINLYVDVITGCLLLVIRVHANDMVNNNGVWMLQQPSQLHGDLGETEPATAEDLAEVAVAVDVLPLMPILQLVVFDVKPQRLHDGSSRLCVHSQQPRQAGVQFILRWLGMDRGSQERLLCRNRI